MEALAGRAGQRGPINYPGRAGMVYRPSIFLYPSFAGIEALVGRAGQRGPINYPGRAGMVYRPKVKTSDEALPAPASEGQDFVSS